MGTFSIKLCGMLLFCNILRIAFYFFHPYSQALLVQSVLMIIVQVHLEIILAVFAQNLRDNNDS